MFVMFSLLQLCKSIWLFIGLFSISRDIVEAVIEVGVYRKQIIENLCSPSMVEENNYIINKKAQLSLTNPRDACEKFARFT